jgi:hypothetical protein
LTSATKWIIIEEDSQGEPQKGMPRKDFQRKELEQWEHAVLAPILDTADLDGVNIRFIATHAAHT